MIRRQEISRCHEESPTSTYFATSLSLSTFIIRQKQGRIWISVACILLLTATFISEGLAREVSTSGNKISSIAHFCYVCLPPGNNLAEAAKALSLSPYETQQKFPDCATFALNLSTDFTLPCPPKYVGCLIRIHGANESRFCAQFPFNDCKQANKGELCYCIKCDAKRLQLSPSTSEFETKSEKVWRSSETDDEDLLQQPYNHLDEMQDDGGDVGSGEWEPPPGVILLETTTLKPTLIPNLRPDSRTTTPTSTSGVDNFSTNEDKWLFVCVLAVSVLL